MLTGPPDASRGADHSVGLSTRFRGINGTLEATYTPSALDSLSVSGLLAGSSNYVNPAYATNLVRNGQGFSPVVFKQNAAGESVASNALAGKVLVELFDPFKLGLSFKAEYFNIGSEYNAIMGARREADVLLTDGIITGGFTRGGQLPTLNIANEFQDWDEPWYESCIGWHGGTGVVEYVQGALKANAEFSFIGYNTNMQNRDVVNQYPNFLYTNGFTNTTTFTADADYANVYDRGKDPRSVYAQYQDRRTMLAVLNLQYLLSFLPGGVLNAKLKYVNDFDGRMDTKTTDDYLGNAFLAFAQVSVQPVNELKTFLGYEFTLWDEGNRNGSQEAGFYGVNTQRHTVRAGLSYAFGGVLLAWTLEYLHNYQKREPYAFNQEWNVWRSKATAEVAF
jgi:hypothetical protein